MSSNPNTRVFVNNGNTDFFVIITPIFLFLLSFPLFEVEGTEEPDEPEGSGEPETEEPEGTDKPEVTEEPEGTVKPEGTDEPEDKKTLRLPVLIVKKIDK